MINASPGGIATLASLAEYRSQRFDQQIANNPYFFNASFPGVLVQPTSYTFTFCFMANHSEKHTVGILSRETLQTWFGIQGENGNYTAPFGQERIPDNWYRRSHTALYGIPYFLGDVVAAAAVHPKFLDIGGNLDGKTNNFAGVDIGNLTGGVFKLGDLLEGNNLGYFAFQAITQVKADLILEDVHNLLQGTVGSIVTQLSCPQLKHIDELLLSRFEGYTRSLNGTNKL